MKAWSRPERDGLPHQCLKCGELFNEGTTIILRGCPECRGTRFFYTQVPLTISEREKLLATSEITLREAIDQLVKNAKDGEPTELPHGPTEWVQLTTGDTASALPKRLEDYDEHAPPPAPVKFTPAPSPIPVPMIEVPKDESTWLPGNKLLIKRTADAALSRRRKAPVEFDYAPPPTAAPVLAPSPAFNPAPEPLTPGVPEEPPLPAPAKESETNAPLSDGPPETIRIANPGEYEIDVKRLLESDPIVIQRDGTYLIHLASLFDANRPKGG